MHVHRQQAHPISSIESRKKPRITEEKTVTLRKGGGGGGQQRCPA